MSDIEDMLNKLGGEFRFDTGHVLLNLMQYSIRNKKYLELLLKNQLEIKDRLNGPAELSDDELEQQYEDTLDEIQRDVEQEYYDLLSFLISRSGQDKDDD
jgi:hypothetical protein